MTRRLVAVSVVCRLVLLAFPAQAVAAIDPVSVEHHLYQAYFLEHETRDFAAARSLYVKVLESNAKAETRQAAQAGADRCRDQMAAENFAALMPPDALFYLELNRPGEVVEKLAGMLGLCSKSIPEVLAARPNTDSAAPIHIPQEFAISPSIFKALNSFGGAAIALTEVDFEGHRMPSGVMVVHHGDMTLLKGCLETCFQFAPTTEKIHGMPTFGVNLHGIAVSGVLTESLLVVGTGRDHVEGVVNRLTGKTRDSLAARKDLQEIFADRPDATLFGFANLQGAYQRVRAGLSEGDRKELSIANTFADLDSLRWATFSIGIDDGTLGMELAVRLADNHRSIVYNMMRLPPMSRRGLNLVPHDAAAVVGIGLNPAIAQAAAGAMNSERTEVTGFDIGREFFGNIQEICAFLVPGKMKTSEAIGSPIPNVGIVLAVNDVAKSKALWNQLLSLPGLFAGDEPVKPKTTEIGTTQVTMYRVPGVTRIYMTEMEGCIAVGLTRTALKAAIRANNSGDSILQDQTLGDAIRRMPEDSSIMVAAHAGRLADFASGQMDAGESMVAKQVGQLCNKTVVWFGLGQSPSRFSMRGAITGLPDLNEVLRRYGTAMNGVASMTLPSGSSVSHEEVAAEVVPR